jgi:hypothetical protein
MRSDVEMSAGGTQIVPNPSFFMLMELRPVLVAHSSTDYLVCGGCRRGGGDH